MHGDAAHADRRWINVVANYFSTMAVVAFGVWFYTQGSRYHLNELGANLPVGAWGISAIGTRQLLVWLGWAYAVILLPYYLLQPDLTAKARVIAAWLAGQFLAPVRPSWGRPEQQAALAVALKFFFVPLMLNWLLGNTAEVLVHWRALVQQGAGASLYPMFTPIFYPLAFKILLMADVFLFTVGYIVEIPMLNNCIESVDPTASGWLVCLLCYPPFNQALNAFIPWQSSDAPGFAHPAMQVAFGCLMLALMGIYAWASVALGLRASNLTNRGIVSRFPYSQVRHPAYAAKNLAWWIGALPTLGIAFSGSVAAGLWATACMAAWTLIYVARALTEERHLLMLDNGYSSYAERVRYRFIPGVI
jgi:protein-S-isoprenylcysteine O-methyltransferase Ste14